MSALEEQLKRVKEARARMGWTEQKPATVTIKKALLPPPPPIEIKKERKPKPGNGHMRARTETMQDKIEAQIKCINRIMSDDKSHSILGVYYNIARVQIAAAHMLGVSPTDMILFIRTDRIVWPRQVAMYVCRKRFRYSFPRIGEAFSGRDHSTVMHAVKRVADEIEQDTDLADTITEINALVDRMMGL